MRKYIILLALLSATTLTIPFYGQLTPEEYEDGPDGIKPIKGFVPDEATAIKVAEAIWTPIFGKETIENERPFKAKLIRHDSVWYVSGTLKEGYVGGTAIITIRKSDCTILYVTHEK